MPLHGGHVTLTAQQALDGIEFTSVEDCGGIPDMIVIIATVSDIVPADCAQCSIALFPGGKFSVGASGGGIGVIATWQRNGAFADNQHYDLVGGNSSIFPDGFFNSGIRAIVASNNFNDCIVDFDVSWIGDDFASFTGPELTDSPETFVVSDGPNWNDVDQEGNTSFTFSYPNTSADNPTGFVLVRSADGGVTKEISANGMWVDGVTDYTITDYFFAPGEYTYWIYAYKSLSLSPLLAPVVVDVSSTPSIIYTGTLQADFSLLSEFVFIGDPSGIYTVVAGKTHDTLYDRTGLVTVDVKIPDPFIKTAYVP